MTSILGPLWESLTRPAVTIYDEGKRRQAKQLAGLIALLNSGYSEQETPRQIEGSHASGYLQRPFNINSLLTKVNQVLSV